MTAPEGLDRYAVIGHPIAHSLSPRIHQLFALQTGQPLRYETLDVLPERLAADVRAFFDAGGRGLNVTIPHKQAVIPLLATLSGRAQRAAAVNTIRRESDGTLLGDNTDGVGLVRDLTVNLHIALQGRRVLLLGAGGAARGVLAPLLEQQPAELVIANRDRQRAAELADAARAAGAAARVVRAAAYGTLDGAFDLILNATAASLQGELPPLPAAVLAGRSICYDLAYGAHPTPFLRWAREHGVAQAHAGLGMLVEQAAESFLLWRGVRPQTAPVLAALRGAPPG